MGVGLKIVLFMKQLAISRKGLRLFKSIEEYHKLQLKLAKSMPVGDFVLEVTTCVGMIFRWGYDNLAFLEKAKVVDAAGYGVKSNKFRVVATVAYIILCLKALARCSTDCA